MQPRAGPQRSRWCRPQASPGRTGPTSGQFSRWGPAPLREAQRGRLPRSRPDDAERQGPGRAANHPRTRGPSLPPACGGLCRPEVGVPLPARRTALLGFSRGAAFTQQLGRLERWPVLPVGASAGIARERETSADDTAPYQREGHTPFGVRESARISGSQRRQPEPSLGRRLPGSPIRLTLR